MLARTLAAILLTVSLPAWGQSCAPRDEVLSHLKAEYGEAPVAVGLASNGGVIELLTSNQGKTWTLMLTLPSGMSCFLVAGEDWQESGRAS